MKDRQPEKGDVVLSLQGRDKAQLYVVCGMQGNMLLLADGKTRTRETPKKKNIKHVKLLAHNVAQYAIAWDRSFENAVAHLLKGLADKS